jgi:signal transduction histidine kinase
MSRAAIFMAGAERRRVRAVGSHGTSPAQLSALRPTLMSTPIAQQALLEDQVIVISEGVEFALPADYAQKLGITTLVCTPLSAAGRSYGVICCDRGGGRFELSDGERHLLWTLGKTAALVTTARNATRQEERARRLGERLELAREIHERVMQRLFGVSLALSAAEPLLDGELERCRTEMGEALAELRRALERPLAPLWGGEASTLEAELERLAAAPDGLPLAVEWQSGVEVPAALEPLLQSVLGEALRNARKHAQPSRIEVAVSGTADTVMLEVRNDGVDPAIELSAGARMGLRLASYEALALGGLLEFGALDGDAWRVRVVAPLEG